MDLTAGAFANRPTMSVDTQAQVRLAKQGDGFVIDRIALVLQAVVAGIGEDRFQEIAQTAKRDCPVSKALAGVHEITLTATRLEQGMAGDMTGRHNRALP